MKQRRWVKYLEDYDFTLHYQPDKANMVVMHLVGSLGECWLVWFPESGRCSRLWDSSVYNTMIRLRVCWGV